MRPGVIPCSGIPIAGDVVPGAAAGIAGVCGAGVVCGVTTTGAVVAAYVAVGIKATINTAARLRKSLFIAVSKRAHASGVALSWIQL